MPRLRLTCIVGARPNFIKISPLFREFNRRESFTPRLVHTGQHFSRDMSDTFFEQLGIPAPDVNFEIGGGSAVGQIGRMMPAIEADLNLWRPDVLVVVGDVNSTLAGALVASKLGIPVAHVEAGLRSFDRTMPEEINRIVTDALSDLLFVSEPSGMENLAREGVPAGRVFFVGNVMIDSLLSFRDRAQQSTILEDHGLEPGAYAVVTLHRPANVDDPKSLDAFMEVLRQLATRIPVVFPLHPRTRNALREARIETGGVTIIEPQPYLDFLRLTSQARLVLTDSGGIQEETTILGVPCLTLRDNTERPVTITHGTNRLAGTNTEGIVRAIDEALSAKVQRAGTPELWDGAASGRIADVLERRYLECG